MVIERDGKKIVLTASEIREAAYEQEFEDACLDARTQTEDYLDNVGDFGFYELFGVTPDDLINDDAQKFILEKLANKFINSSDCNIDENSRWDSLLYDEFNVFKKCAITQEQYLKNAELFSDDIYMLQGEKENVHVLAFADTINSCRSAEEPKGMYLPKNASGIYPVFWDILQNEIDEKNVTLYGGEDCEGEKTYYERFLFSDANDNAKIVVCASQRGATDYLETIKDGECVTLCILNS